VLGVCGTFHFRKQNPCDIECDMHSYAFLSEELPTFCERLFPVMSVLSVKLIIIHLIILGTFILIYSNNLEI